MKVVKFGGTSVGSAANIRKVRDIVLSQKEDAVVVVSAVNGITDLILNAAQTASAGSEDFKHMLAEF